jgi:hypothetical protein
MVGDPPRVKSFRRLLLVSACAVGRLPCVEAAFLLAELRAYNEGWD